MVLQLTAIINPSLVRTLLNCPIVRGWPVENSECRRVCDRVRVWGTEDGSVSGGPPAQEEHPRAVMSVRWTLVRKVLAVFFYLSAPRICCEMQCYQSTESALLFYPDRGCRRARRSSSRAGLWRLCVFCVGQCWVMGERGGVGHVEPSGVTPVLQALGIGPLGLKLVGLQEVIQLP